MMKYLDPKLFGLPPRTIVQEIDNDTIALVIDRKSRIIMADTRKIMDRLDIIRNHTTSKNIILKTTAPVCSKTMAYFERNGIKLLKMRKES